MLTLTQAGGKRSYNQPLSKLFIVSYLSCDGLCVNKTCTRQHTGRASRPRVSCLISTSITTPQWQFAIRRTGVFYEDYTYANGKTPVGENEDVPSCNDTELPRGSEKVRYRVEIAYRWISSIAHLFEDYFSTIICVPYE